MDVAPHQCPVLECGHAIFAVPDGAELLGKKKREGIAIVPFHALLVSSRLALVGPRLGPSRSARPCVELPGFP